MKIFNSQIKYLKNQVSSTLDATEIKDQFIGI